MICLSLQNYMLVMVCIVVVSYSCHQAWAIPFNWIDLHNFLGGLQFCFHPVSLHPAPPVFIPCT